MIDLDLNAVLTQPLVRHVRPQGTNGFQIIDALAPSLLGVQLGTQSLRFHLASSAQDVRVEIAVVALPAGRMNGDIDRTPFPVRHVLGEIHRQPPPLSRRKLGRQGHLELTRHASILALLGQLGGVPKARPMGRPFGRAIGQHEIGGLDTPLAGVVVDLAGPLVCDLAPGAIGRCSCRTATGRAGDRFDAEVVDRHGRCWSLVLPAGPHESRSDS